jgi:hypothetical protein
VWSDVDNSGYKEETEGTTVYNCSTAVSAITNATRAYPILNVLISITKLDFNIGKFI